MSGMTPAQAAYEGMRAQAIADGITEPLSDRIAWEGVERWQRGRWDAAAQAVLNQALPALRQQIADLKRERDEALSLTGEILAKFHTASRSLVRAETEPATYQEWRRRYLDARDRAQAGRGACGECEDGLVPIGRCNCGSPADASVNYAHERLCGFEPCPNGCWERLHPAAAASGTEGATS